MADLQSPKEKAEGYLEQILKFLLLLCGICGLLFIYGVQGWLTKNSLI